MNKQDKGFYGWKVLAALWLIMFVNVAFPFFGASIINTWMAAEFNLDRKMLGLPFTVFILMTGLPAPLIAIGINRWGVRFALCTGSIIITIGSIIMAQLGTNGIQAVFGFGIIVGIGTAMAGALASQTCVAFWFIKKRALALSIVMSAPGFGGFVATRVLNGIITSADGNWRMGWWLIAGLSCLSFLAATLVVKNKPASVGQLPDGDGGGDESTQQDQKSTRKPAGVYKTTEDWTFAEVLRTRMLWLILACTVGFSSCFMLFLAHGVVHLQDLGHTPTAAAASLSFMTFCSLIGNFGIGILGDRVEPRYLWIVTIVLCAMAMLLVNGADSPLKLYPYAICLGIGFGGAVICMMTLISNFYGSKAYASVVGLVLAVQTSASASVPLIAGYIFDGSGSYSVVFYTLATWCSCCAVMVYFTKPPLHVRAQEEAYGQGD